MCTSSLDLRSVLAPDERGLGFGGARALEIDLVAQFDRRRSAHVHILVVCEENVRVSSFTRRFLVREERKPLP